MDESGGMTISIRPELEVRLRRKAAREGKEPDAVAADLLAAALDWEELDRQEALAGIQRGLEASAAGRVRSLSQVIDEARRRHGFPDSWPLRDDSA